jgi:hypothetical protein
MAIRAALRPILPPAIDAALDGGFTFAQVDGRDGAELLGVLVIPAAELAAVRAWLAEATRVMSERTIHINNRSN